MILDDFDENEETWDYGANSYRSYPWIDPSYNEEYDIEYVLGRVLYRPNGKTSWIDWTGFIEDIDEANFAIECIEKEFGGRIIKSGVRVLAPEKNTRQFEKYLRIRINPLERKRFETGLADCLGCSQDKIEDMALSF